MNIEVAYAEPFRQHIEALEVAEGSSVQDALNQITEIPLLFPNLTIDPKKIGVFSKHVQLETVLHEGDRIEIYRPLTIDPKDARRYRVQQK